MRKIDAKVGRKFAIATGILMTRTFSTELEPNPRRLMFTCGPALTGKMLAMPKPELKFDVLGLGFRPGREWKGPSEIFIEEMRDDELNVWTGCRLYASTDTGPIYVLTADPELCFSFDGNALIALLGRPVDSEEGVRRARDLLRTTVSCLPEEIEHQRMM
jgi:hypothetical protein